jgi:hypothetical protein
MRHKLIAALVLLIIVGGTVIFLRESPRVATRKVDYLYAVNAAQVLYARTHPTKGFAPSLAELGPSPGAALIDPGLASGKKSGYVFILNTAPPDSSGRIMHYTLVARPETYRTESLSFFIDESGVERFTVDNRAATVNDLPTGIK